MGREPVAALSRLRPEGLASDQLYMVTDQQNHNVKHCNPMYLFVSLATLLEVRYDKGKLPGAGKLQAVLCACTRATSAEARNGLAMKPASGGISADRGWPDMATITM